MSLVDVDELERQLLEAGRVERASEEMMRDLCERCRTAGAAGRFEEADRMWEMVVAAQTRLRELQPVIS